MLKKAASLAAILILCTACSKLEKQYGAFTPDRNAAYLKQNPTPPLVMPAGYTLDARQATDHYPLPTGPRPGPNSEPISIIPPTLTQELGGVENAKS